MNSSPVFEEQILPNKKYYYTFRAVDIRGHISNPTEVYEVELIDEKGAVRPIIRTINIDPGADMSLIDECQKYIYIKPSLKQMYFNTSSDVDSIFSDESKPKKYKLRLTSKGTGKKVDINFSFFKKVPPDTKGVAINPEDLELQEAKPVSAAAEEALGSGKPWWLD